ncbi:MAG TPA: fibronectin type III domain-containing protein [Steroidobacteraceae bacterium]|nr:fibronectin type III domain-containing protein [Steroidobacteraceae bacterium]
MTNAKRGRGSRRGVYVGAVAALGFALSGCGGSGTGGSSSAVAAASGSTTTASTTPAQSTSAGGGTSASTTSGDTASGSGTASTGTASTSTGSSPSTKSSDAVTVNWTPPTENTNGSPLTNLAGYNIHYGTSSASLTKTISISNPGIATYVVSNLTPGQYYFAVAAVNSAGTESPLSAQVSATVTN